MPRGLSVAAAALFVAGAATVGAVATTQDSGGPAPSAPTFTASPPVSPSTAPSTPPSTAPSAAPSGDTAAVCIATADRVTKGLELFVSDMEQVSTQAGQGDLVGAETSVRKAGMRLVTLATQLRNDAKDAGDATLKSAVDALAAEFQKLGESLNGLTALQTFDTTKLDGLAETMGRLCGGTPSPTPTGSPLPTSPGTLPTTPQASPTG